MALLYPPAATIKGTDYKLYVWHCRQPFNIEQKWKLRASAHYLFCPLIPTSPGVEIESFGNTT